MNEDRQYHPTSTLPTFVGIIIIIIIINIG
jgi:hypothetical protein